MSIYMNIGHMMKTYTAGYSRKNLMSHMSVSCLLRMVDRYVLRIKCILCSFVPLLCQLELGDRLFCYFYAGDVEDVES